MAKVFDWFKLALENWKTVLSILTLLIGFISSGVGNVLKSQEVESYKTGYEVLAHNVSVSSQNKPIQKPIVPRGTCDCGYLESRIIKLERHH